MRARRDAALRLLKTMLVASIAIPVAIFTYASGVAYRDAFVRADEQLEGRLDIIAEYASRIFQSVDLTFTSVDTLVDDLPTTRSGVRADAHLKLSKNSTSRDGCSGLWARVTS